MNDSKTKNEKLEGEKENLETELSSLKKEMESTNESMKGKRNGLFVLMYSYCLQNWKNRLERGRKNTRL